ncbi:MAG: hypothetical protein KDC12_15080, partial [Flavobacteriales bacterium]|nr:hypothetical protein [Flavobacteriales bacterium]
RILKSVDPSGWNNELLHMLENRQTYPVDQLPATGVPADKEQQLSALNVQMYGYGTRVHTVLRVHNNHIFVTEKGENGVREFEFQIAEGM